ncbi:2-oxoglutarate dehydrogenase E1 component [Tautonia sociabilis]|uniref:oxoglutarate dehydrogenase (succinyl-transferring) n=1 Tax=Tautonia sociabilis TaxID=2080755 RepID=A0A432MKS9_9BACT|nr:2-oxoglutarate dehydrogenase E1 component [Tautonia sociabilis]RUL87817.1 2-oxoglutarate dehydrogenase E1 component [Tautonia sociabilis]
MNRSTVANRWNQDLIEENFLLWQRDPDALEASWRHFFEGFELGRIDGAPPGAQPPGAAAPPSSSVSAVDDEALENARAQAAVTRLVDAYREVGHYLADLDPLRLAGRRETYDPLELAEFGLGEEHLDRPFFTRMFEPPQATLRELLDALKRTYCGTIGVEYMHIRDRRIRSWLQERMEPVRNHPSFDLKKKRRILWKLNAASLFETFLHLRYVGQKRFSLEGGEMLIPLLDAIVERSATFGVKEIVLGMPHRGRLNVLANILNKPYSMIFHEFEGNMPKTVAGDGDVKYHLGFSADHVAANGHSVHLSLTANPSHLEAVDPVVEGRMRAKQRLFKDRDRKLGLPILIHGDAAFAGQGLVAETLNLSQLPGYRTGGTIHIVVNNQIGFTTAPMEGRSTRYCTDVAKMIEVPIFHVNGDDPEAVVYVGELATEFRETFGQDVVIDMVCYRRHGHNESDEPAFTQPVMYEAIRRKKPVLELYTRHLIDSGELTQEEADTLEETFREKLEAIYKEVHDATEAPEPIQPGFKGPWEGLQPNYDWTPIDTGVPRDRLALITDRMAAVPEGFTRNRKLDRIFSSRVQALQEGGPIDWAFAEGLAFGSLLLEGTPVRLSGQDSRRGTFSQRHASIVDVQTGERFYPLNHIAPGQQAEFCVYDSMLSEAAVLGFDYGYSLDSPHMLICWEAQFGDFANGAQVIIDQFIASGESKWGRASGIVLLLPHGYEGQGPEHSSARLERFLQLCAEDNMQVVNCTTPAQYFHLLRRQVRRTFRKPLVVMTPKSLLRHKRCVSSVEEFTAGGFNEVLDDGAIAAPEKVRRVVLCSGKVYYDLLARREASEKDDVALVRLEQFYPFPANALSAALARFENATEWVWAQEESQNMGGWTFVAPRLEELTGRRFQYVGRDASASPATGSLAVHNREQEELVEAALGASALPHLVTASAARKAVAASNGQR